MRESAIQNAILMLGRGAVRLFRNQVGHYELKDGRHLSSGLCKGSADLIGWRSVTITPDMVGQRYAVFCAVEVKRPGEKPTPEQRAFLAAVQDAGGLAGVATSVEEAQQILGGSNG